MSPEQAFAVAEEKLGVAKTKLPELLAMTKGADTKVSAVFFEGLKGIKQLAEYRLKDFKGEEALGFWATDKQAPEELTQYFHDEFPGKLDRYGIKMRGIVPNDPALAFYRERDEQFGRTMKVVPQEQYSSEVAIEVLGSVVRISDYKNLQGIAIENADIAKTMREIFEMVWSRVESTDK